MTPFLKGCDCVLLAHEINRVDLVENARGSHHWYPATTAPIHPLLHQATLRMHPSRPIYVPFRYICPIHLYKSPFLFFFDLPVVTISPPHFQPPVRSTHPCNPTYARYAPLVRSLQVNEYWAPFIVWAGKMFQNCHGDKVAPMFLPEINLHNHHCQ